MTYTAEQKTKIVKFLETYYKDDQKCAYFNINGGVINAKGINMRDTWDPSTHTTVQYATVWFNEIDLNSDTCATRTYSVLWDELIIDKTEDELKSSLLNETYCCEHAENNSPEFSFDYDELIDLIYEFKEEVWDSSSTIVRLYRYLKSCNK